MTAVQHFKPIGYKQVGALVLPKWVYNGAKVLTILIRFKVVILHTYIKFGENHISTTLVVAVIDDGKTILLEFNCVVQLGQVASPVDAAILLGNNERETHPFTLILGYEIALFNKVIQFMFEYRQMNARQNGWGCFCTE